MANMKILEYPIFYNTYINIYLLFTKSVLITTPLFWGQNEEEVFSIKELKRDEIYYYYFFLSIMVLGSMAADFLQKNIL